MYEVVYYVIHAEIKIILVCWLLSILTVVIENSFYNYGDLLSSTRSKYFVHTAKKVKHGKTEGQSLVDGIACIQLRTCATGYGRQWKKAHHHPTSILAQLNKR